MNDWREISGDQNLRMAQKMLDQQGEIERLTAANASLHASLERYDAQAFDDLLANNAELATQNDALAFERNNAVARLAELNNAITWHTSCLNCSSLLDASYAETVRAEKAEEALRRAQPVLDALRQYKALLESRGPLPSGAVVDAQEALVATLAAFDAAGHPKAVAE